MEKKTLSNDQILDAIYDLADESGMKIDDFILKLQADAEASGGKSREGLPEEIISELEEARMLKKENRNSKKESQKSENIKKEIERFKTTFPDAMPQDIPDSVWEEVAGGVSLVHAYALYLITESRDSEYASKVNDENSLRATSKTGDGETEPVYTKEQVEVMSPKEVSKNYKHILKSISKWKL
ncbi:MAG: hypothetical protein A2Y15_05655 [Clostridiales bacterium GWF2_36_10]|nr:MAG: hypothetical protein A2Y15_05655 [Clostridiales bacterium GWF2_36_10]HAN21971.1 hypothetical protein [Clostridiales bacterium]